MVAIGSEHSGEGKGPTFSGRAGAGHLSNHEDRDARPVRCSGWLSRLSVAVALQPLLQKLFQPRSEPGPRIILVLPPVHVVLTDLTVGVNGECKVIAAG